MLLYSTNNPQLRVDLAYAVMKGLPDDNGLFMPLSIPRLPDAFFSEIEQLSLPEIAYTVCEHLFDGYIPENDLRGIVERAINFPAPLVKVAESMYSLELFHGPSMAFKDFGARFMAQLMSYFNRNESSELTILVATSGDTGGAVAAGFLGTPGIRIVILYPSGKVSPLQEKQLTTLGKNITALEIDGTFDDCQALVKKAFLDTALCARHRLSSANSINIARLIPQSFYYMEAWKQLPERHLPCIFSVPSGNLGNLTAGIMAQKMGLPVSQFVAATNANDVVPVYLDSGNYAPRVSQRTLSNAMDVGNPSNFVRMSAFYGSTWNIIKQHVQGMAITDTETESTLRTVLHENGYLLDPHGAVGYLALKRVLAKTQVPTNGIFLETAHPAKFREEVERILGESISMPDQLAKLVDLPKNSVRMNADFDVFKSFLMSLPW